MALTFDYKVRDRSGNLVQGQLEGDSTALVAGRLREMGYLPISVTPRSRLKANMEIAIPGITDRVKLAELAVATRQLATMIDSGLSVVRALAILATQVDNKELARVVGEVRLEVEHGSSLSAACARFPKVFNELFVTMVQAGEVGGSLDAVLLDLAATMEKQAELNRKIRTALTYPAVVVSVMVVIFVALLVFVVPVFEKIFTQLHATLPGPTQVIIHLSAILLSWWVLVVVAVVAAGVVALRRWITTDAGRRRWDRLKLRPPVFGPLMHKVALARFASTLASLVQAGVPILESLDIVSDATGNQTVSDALQDAKAGVREGRSFADVLRDHEDVVPSLVVQMVEVGEQTGALDAMLRKVAQFYDGEVANTVANLTSLLEPMLTVFMGAGVGVMVISMYLPMFEYLKHVSSLG
ncbi:MAG: type II secretion system F family protein [Actinomycetota bacterium]|jgi:type IV pilus assembly protein PilC|nr:type II secretion system F family protein [Actinomycetota bacterium]